MKFKDLVLCSDLDGTLLNENNEIPKVNIEAIEYFKAHGGKFMLATGRLPEAVIPVIGDIELDFPCICHNGCSLYDLKRREYKKCIPLDDGVTEAVKRVLDISPTSGVEVMNKDGICVVKSTPITEFHMEYEKITPTYADKIEDVKKPWIKILFGQAAEETEKIRHEFLNSSNDQGYTYVRTHALYYEIFNKDASKGKALCQLCNEYKIDLKNVIAIGDNENDISMLSVAGVGVAVKNSSDIVKEYADIITCSNEEGAIADLISRL